MSRVERLARRVDDFQQRHRPLAFIYGVIKKVGDDKAGSLAALLVYYAVLSLFPLLLILVTVLGLVAGSDPGIEQQILNSALRFKLSGPQHSASHPDAEDVYGEITLALLRRLRRLKENPDEQTIREHSRKSGIPANRISAVRRLIDPTSFT